MATSSATNSHAWVNAACIQYTCAMLHLLAAICINIQRARPDDIFGLSASKIRLSDHYEDADPLLRRVQRKHLRPYLVERSMENLRATVSTIVKKLERKSGGVG